MEGDISNDADLAELVRGVDALVILTSAVPKPKVLSIFKAIVSKVLPWMENRRPEFYFPDGGSPSQVDWLWQKAQIDAAAAAGVKKVVLVSSMGGTQIDNFLNTMGAGGDVGDANILLWKRKAEMHLVASGEISQSSTPEDCSIRKGGQGTPRRRRRHPPRRRSTFRAARGRGGDGGAMPDHGRGP